MSNLGAFAWTLFFCAILAHAGVKTEVFYSIYWLHIHRDKVSMHPHSEMEMERGRKVGMEGEAQSGKEEVGILHFAYKEVSVGRSNAAARGKKKGEGNGGTHHHPSAGASSTV